jgi:hypothetical protein
VILCLYLFFLAQFYLFSMFRGRGKWGLRLTIDIVKYSKSHGMEKGARREERE